MIGLVLKFSNSMFAIDILSVKLVTRVLDIMQDSQSDVKSSRVTRVRGKVLPIIYLNDIFDIKPIENIDNCRFITISTVYGDMCLLVDSVEDIVTFSEEDYFENSVSNLESSTRFARSNNGDVLILIADDIAKKYQSLIGVNYES